MIRNKLSLICLSVLFCFSLLAIVACGGPTHEHTLVTLSKNADDATLYFDQCSECQEIVHNHTTQIKSRQDSGKTVYFEQCTACEEVVHEHVKSEQTTHPNDDETRYFVQCSDCYALLHNHVPVESSLPDGDEMKFFVQCSECKETLHEHNVETEKFSQGNIVTAIPTCQGCGMTLPEYIYGTYLADGLLQSTASPDVIIVENEDGLINFNLIMAGYYSVPNTLPVNAATFGGKTLMLAADMDISNASWFPFRFGIASNAMVLDGNGHTITGLKLNGSTDVGFFGLLAADLTVRNLNFKEAQLETTGKWCGILVGHIETGSLVVENVNFYDCKVLGTVEPKAIRLGCIVGYCLVSSCRLTIKNCTVENSLFYGYHNTCALVGTLGDAQLFENNWNITGCSVKNNTFKIGATVHKYVNPFAVDTSYMERDAMENYMTERGNTHENNSFDYGVTQNYSAN